MNPSLKPERGGTIREHGFWNNLTHTSSGDTQKRHCHPTNSPGSRRSETTDPDRITRWNTARDISKTHERTTSPPRRVVSESAKPLPALPALPAPDISDRRRGWAQQVDKPKQGLAKNSGQGDMKVNWQNFGLEDDSEVEPSQRLRTVKHRLSDAHRVIEAKKKVRRQRRSLKESGDYLGVQGINPETGRLDILTPSNSDNSTSSGDTEQNISALRQALRNVRNTHRATSMHNEREAKHLLLKKEKEKLEKKEREKEALARQTQDLRWRRHTRQWSSAQEPSLSPFLQPQKGGIPPVSSECPIFQAELFPLMDRNPGKQPHSSSEMGEEDLLVDLSFPQKLDPSETKLDDPAIQEGSSLISLSSGTVVRTPHGRSLEVARSAAQELFENGISFNNSEHFGERDVRNDGAHDSSAPPMGDVVRPTTRRARIDPPHIQREVLEENLSTRADHGSVGSERDSFLDISALGEAASQGQSSTIIPRPFPKSDLLKPQKPSTLRRRTILFRNKHKRYRRLDQGSSHMPSPELHSVKSLRISATHKTPTEALAPPGETHQSNGASSHHRSSPTHLLQYLKKDRRAQACRPLDREGETFASRELRPMTNLRPTQRETSPDTQIGRPKVENLSSLKETALKSEIPTRDGIKRDLDLLETEVAKLSGLYWMNEQIRPNPLLVDHEWIEGTIGDIAEKATRDMGVLPFTPTTTTTGSDHPTSASNPNRETGGQRQSGWRGRAKSHPYEKPIWSTADVESMASLQKTAPSSLLSLTPEGQIVPIDITSTRTYSLARGWTDPPLPSKGQWNSGLEEKSFRHSMSPTSTFAVGRKVSTFPKTRDLLRAQKPDKDSERSQTRTTRHLALDSKAIEVNHSSSGGPRKGLVHSELDGKTPKMSPKLQNSLRNLTKDCPGAYPFYLDVEEDTDARFETTLKRMISNLTGKTGKEEAVGTFDAVRNFVLVARCHISILVHLYWSLTGPIFDPSSEYWVRNAKGEATLMDGITFVLAIPCAFLGLLVFV